MALEAILQPMLVFAGEISELRLEAGRICSAAMKDYGKVVQTFASAIQSELLDLDVFLASKQRFYQRQRRGNAMPDHVWRFFASRPDC